MIITILIFGCAIKWAIEFLINPTKVEADFKRDIAIYELDKEQREERDWEERRRRLARRKQSNVKADKIRLEKKYKVYFSLTDDDYLYYQQLEKFERKEAKKKKTSEAKAKALIDSLMKSGTIPKDTQVTIS